MINIEDFRMIYDSLNNSVSEIITKLESKSDDEDFDKIKVEVLNIIKVFQEEKLNKAISELKENQEWDKFTVAFYGETNAGKSTIIESLRIYFKEKEKLEQQMKFKAVLGEYEQNINGLENEIFNNKKEISDFEEKKGVLVNNLNVEKEELEFKLNELITADKKKKESSIVYKILSLLHFINIYKKIDEIKKISKAKEKISEEEIRKIEIISNIKKNEILEIEEKITNLKSTSSDLLHSFRDGQIIGDGRSDFTQKSKVYNFSHNNQEFAFLDVPGIEGHETIVIDEISSAVKKAHAIFYVTSSSSAPQKGDENKKGTLEKIKDHLGSQTEVYTIFNKRINNPMQLNKLLINDDEKESLKIIDEKIIEILGENYVGHKSVSAKIAFLALADCLLKESGIFNEQHKFLDIYSVDELLEKALFNDFCKFITEEMVINTKQKIKKSNYNKANNLLQELIDILSIASKENFEPLYNEVVKEADNASNNLKNTSRKLKIDLESIVERNLRDFESNIRREIYSNIERNITDDSFKNTLELLLKENLEKMKKIIPLNIENEISKFQNSIVEVLENFKRRVDLAIQDYQTFNFDSEFNINLQIDNGIDKMGLAGSFLGAGGLAYSAIMFSNGWNPLGWTMFGIGVVTVIVGAYKSFRKWFSNDYKKAEQRNSANKNLKQIMENIKPKIMENIKPISNDISVKIDEIIDDLEKVVNQRKIANEYIKESYKDLLQIAKQIKSEGSK